MKAIILLTGKNEVFRREAADKMTTDIPRDETAVYYADETDPGVVFAQCLQNSLFGDNNVVIVRNIDDIKGDVDKEERKRFKSRKDKFDQLLMAYIENPNSDTTLILDWESPSEKIKKLLTKSPDAEVLEFKKLYRRDLIPYVQTRLKQSDIRCEPSVPDLVVSLANEDIAQIAMMTTLLIGYAGVAKTIGFEDAKECLSRVNNLSIFDFVDAVFSRDIGKALSALSDLRLAGEQVIVINSMLLRKARLMWGYLAQRTKPNLAATLQISDFELRKLAESAAKVGSLRFVSQVFELVKEVEVKSKSMDDDFAFLAIENFIFASKSIQ